jgi:hypothetical protein
MPRPMDDYVEVAERIEKFYKQFPKGSLRCKEIRNVHIGDADFLVYVAQAFRDPEDQAPAEGSAWEPVPGKTNFTRDSELMNAETSAWGRAIAALGFEVKRGIASKQEVMNRRNGDEEPQSARVGFASDKQKGFFERLLKQASLDSNQVAGVIRFTEQLPTERVSKAIDGLNDDDTDLAERTVAALLRESDAWARLQSDVPFDDAA